MTAREKWAEVRAMDVPVQLLLGPNTSDRFLMDPKRIGFYALRYTFAAKMLRNCTSILDIGCGDGLMTTTFLHDTKAQTVLGIDFDPELIAYANNVLLPAVHRARPNLSRDSLTFRCGDFLNEEVGEYDAVVSMDCIEHIDPDQSHVFIERMHDALSYGGVAIIGTPNKYAEHLGSPHSRTGHINSMTPEDLRTAMEKEFPRVFMLGLNDGTLNVGHEHLWHYVIGVAVAL